MGHQVLVTIDLPSATPDQREAFYEVLTEEKWQKITTLTTSWQISFNDGSSRVGAINTLENDLKKAKGRSKAPTVEYALQLDIDPVNINSL